VRWLLGLSQQKPNGTFADSLDVYGLGAERSLAQYYEFSNIDAAANTSHSAEKFCGPVNGLPPTKCLASISIPIMEPLVGEAVEDGEALEASRRLLLRVRRMLSGRW